ncbi:MAG TPA: TolC family protein [Puia sp.]|jgi:outer membrane protein|nr:TolC family protein [Puia sp.]
MKKHVAFICSFLLLVSFQISAQDSISQSNVKWDLQQCLDHAKKNNITVNILRYSKDLSGQDLLLARAARLPNLNGTLSHSLTNSKNANPVVGGFQTQSSIAGNYSLNTGFTVYNGGFLKNDVRQKGLLVEAANLDIKVAENDITLQITQAYLNILLAKENIVYITDVLATSNAQLQQGKQRFDAGALSRKDLWQLEGQAASDQFNLVNVNTIYRQNIITLKQILQLPSSVTFEVVEPDSVTVREAVPSLAEAERAALDTRPEVQNGALAVEIAEVELLKARALGKPSITVGGNLSSGYSDNQTTKYFSQIDNNFYQRLGVTVGIPIFNNRAVKTNVERSKILIEQAKLSLAGTKTTLDQVVEQAYINVINAQAQFSAAEVQLKANEESYKITSGQLEFGAVNTLDLQLQKNLYVQAVQSYIQAKYNALLNVKVYNFYTGVPVTL